MNYVEAYNTLFIPINNTLNSFCYHLTVVQQLHTSETFNNLMQTYNSGNKYIDMMLLPFKTYATINKDSYKDIYKQIKQDYETMINSVISEYGKNGYSPFIVLYFYILPIIYHCFKNEFKQICIEASIDPTFLRNPDVAIENQIETAPLVKKEFIDFQKTMTEEMNAAKVEFDKGQFRGGILEVYPNEYSYDGGHALFILRNQDKYYIFDDDTTIDLFRDYLMNRTGFVHRICIRGIDDNIAHDLEKLWGSNVVSKRVNNRYEFVSRKKNELNGADKDIIILRQSPLLIEMNGGYKDDQKHLSKLALILSIIILIISIIVVVIIVIVNKRSNENENLNNQK